MLISSLIIIPLLGVIFIILLEPSSDQVSSSRRSKRIGLNVSLINWILSIILWTKFDTNSSLFQFIEEYSIVPLLNNAYVYNGPNLILGIDGISIYFVLLTTFLIPICILISWNTNGGVSNHQSIKGLIILYLILESLLIGVFVVLDLLMFYVLFESVLIPMFLIIGIWGSRSRKIHAAYQFFLYTLLGSLFMLLAILMIWNITGSTDYLGLLSGPSIWVAPTAPTNYAIYEYYFWLAFFFSFAVKTPIIPFHIWLPEAHVEAPTGGSVLLAGILLKLASYGFLRYSIPLFSEASLYFTPLIICLSVISIIYSSLTTLRQIDLKKIIAYSSIAHMGVVNIGIFSNNITGIEGSILLILAHGIVSPALFICVAVLYDRHHTRIINYYRGLTLTMPIYSTFLFLFTLANMGTPLTGNYIGEFLSFAGAFQISPIIISIGAISIVLSAVYSIWLYTRITGGHLISTSQLSTGPWPKSYVDMTRRETYILVPLLLLTFIMGIYPDVFLNSIHLSISTLIMTP